MKSLPPELFYTGIVAEVYGPLRSDPPDARIYAGFVRRVGEPALELGCGDGDPLLDLVAAGLDVEGLDSSPDMLGRCRTAAAARGLEVVLHEQAMQSMDLDRRYRSIYVAGPTFNLLPDDDVALQALRRVSAHLAPVEPRSSRSSSPSPWPPRRSARPGRAPLTTEPSCA